MRTITRPLLGALALLAFGITSTVSAQLAEAPTQLADEQSPIVLNGTATLAAPIAPQSFMVADTFYYEDFSNGTTGWSFENILPDSVSVWEYITNPDLSARNQDTRYQTFASPSVGNGFMFFDYRFFLQDNGIPIAQPYPELKGNFISPNIDMSTFPSTGKYAINFYSYQPTLNATNCRVDIRAVDGSVPDATIWNAFQDVARPDVAPQELQLGAIPQAFIGLDSVELVFVHDGDFYGWAIDDILITELPPIEVQTNDFIAVAPNWWVPTHQASGIDMAFLADIQNNGALTLDLKLAITIADAAGTTVYTDTTLYTGIPTDSLAENQAFGSGFPMPTAVGEYTGTYELFTDRIAEDAAPDNNAQTFTFFVTENSYSKGNDGLRTVQCCADNAEYRSTNIYTMPNIGATDSMFIDTVSFAITYTFAEAADEGFVEVKVYGYRGDLNGDGVPVFGDDPTDADAELVELSLSDYVLSGTAANSDLPSDAILNLPASTDGPVYVPNDYIGFAIAVDYFQVDGGTNVDNIFAVYGQNISYSAFEIAADSINSPLLSHTLVVPSRGIDTYGHFSGVAPFIDAQVDVRPFVSSSKETLLAASAFSVRPNPATTQFAIDFDFGTTVNAQFEIINAVGQTVSSFNRDGLSSGAITIPTTGMNNGLYYVKVRTNDGQTASRKLLLNK